MNLERKTGLTPGDLDMIRRAAGRHRKVEKLTLFGSRAKGCHRKGSDVDLAVHGKGVDDGTLGQLTDELNEVLPLPYFFDVLNYDGIAEPALKEHIDRVGLEIYHRGKNTPQHETKSSFNAI